MSLLLHHTSNSCLVTARSVLTSAGGPGASRGQTPTTHAPRLTHCSKKRVNVELSAALTPHGDRKHVFHGAVSLLFDGFCFAHDHGLRLGWRRGPLDCISRFWDDGGVLKEATDGIEPDVFKVICVASPALGLGLGLKAQDALPARTSAT